MLPEIALWSVCGLPSPPTLRIIPQWCHAVIWQRRTSCHHAVLWSWNTAVAVWAASPAVFKGASLTWSWPPVLAYSRVRPCCSYQWHLVEVTVGLLSERLYQQGGASTLQRLPSFSLSQRASWCLHITGISLRHRTVSTSTQHCAPPYTELFYSPLSGNTRVSWYQKKHSPTHTYPDNQPSFISFLHLLWSTASSLFNLRAWQSFGTTSLHVLFGLPLGLAPSTSYSIHFFTQSLSSFSSTCPYHHNLVVVC